MSLRTDRVEFDARCFEEAIKNGDANEALGYYDGPFADNLVGTGTPEFERWLDSERDRLARLAEMSLRRLVREFEEAGRWGEMCVAGLKLVAMAPLDEEVHRWFMRALWMNGDPSASLRHFEEVLGPLESDLGGGLSEETLSLLARIREKPRPEEWTGGSSINRELPLIGREEQFRRLRLAVEAIGTSTPPAVLLLGDQGMGKSRILKELEQSLLPEPVRVLRSCCYQAEEALPYTPIVDGLTPLAEELVDSDPSLKDEYSCLGQLIPCLLSQTPTRLPRPADAGVWQRQLYSEFAALISLATEVQPIIWLVDDVQWLDRTSTGLLHYLARQLTAKRFLLVAAMRREQQVVSIPFCGSQSSDDGGPVATIVDLPALTETGVRKLVASASPGKENNKVAELAVRLASGNPYYALEVLEAAAESDEWIATASEWDPLTHDRLREVLAVRVGGLDPASIRMLQAIAVLERNARPRVIAEIAGLPLMAAATHSEELYRRGLVIDKGARVAFAADTMREYVYSEMTAIRRAALHLSAGRILESEAHPKPGPLATHFYNGGDWLRSFSYAMEAARDAQRKAGHAEAAHFASIAVATAPGKDEQRVALEAQAESSRSAGDLETAAGCYLELIRQCASEKGYSVRAWLSLADVEVSRCGWNAARSSLLEAQALIEGVDDREVRLLLGAQHAELTMKLGFLTDDVDAARRAEAPIDELLHELEASVEPPGDVAFRVLSTKAIQETITGSSRVALSILGRANRYVETTSMLDVARYKTLRGYVRTKLAKWDEAEADLKEALAAYREVGDVLSSIRIWNNLVCISTERGQWAESAERLEQAKSLQSTLSSRVDTSLALVLNRANMLFYQGLLAAAAEEYCTAKELAAVDHIHGAALEVNSCLGLVALQRGDLDAAMELWNQVRALRDERGFRGGAQEKFKLSWFSSWMTGHAVELDRAEDEERDRDLPSFAKTRWLKAALRGEQQAVADASKELDAIGMRWFSAFASRWYRTASRLRRLQA